MDGVENAFADLDVEVAEVGDGFKLLRDARRQGLRRSVVGIPDGLMFQPFPEPAGLERAGAGFGHVNGILAFAVVAITVGAYITAAYWFTASTSFANPAVTVARCLSDTFAGIRPTDVLGFVLAQLAGGIAATVLFGWLMPTNHNELVR